MNALRFIFVLVVAALALSACESFDTGQRAARASAARPVHKPPEEYRLSTGDVISVRVYGGEEEIRIERLRLDGSGTVVLPFGDFKATGKTTRELEAAITGAIKGRLLKNPRVSVNIDEYRPFFVDGQVGRPGAYPYQPGLTVRKAITIAGGLRERASLKKIFLLSESDKTHTPVNVDLNTPVGPGDTINVEESFF
jgi:polysaccharide export outer membrane protein